MKNKYLQNPMWESEGERNKYGECQSEVKLELHNVK